MAHLGIRGSLQVAQLLHIVMVGMLVAFGLIAELGPIYYSTITLIVAALIYEHRSARALDLAGINRAFFQSNAFVSAVFLVAVCLDRLA